MTSTLFRLSLGTAWIAALWGCLQVYRFDLHLGHGMCGPWGCGPPGEALIGYHGFWLTLILPPVVCLGLFLSPLLNSKIGLGVLLLGMVGTVAYVGWDLATFAQSAQSSQYLAQRGLFTLVTTVDLPMIQTIIAGGLLTFVFGRRPVKVDPASGMPADATPIATP